MDVRIVDSIATKRMEVEKTRPVNQKAHAFMDEREVARQVDSDAEDQEMDQQPEQKDEEEHFDAQDTGSAAAPDISHGDYHELDVRV